MDIKTYYEQLDDKATPPKTSFLEQVMKETGKTRMTIYRWLNGTTKPDKANMAILSKITGIALDELFPEDVEKEV